MLCQNRMHFEWYYKCIDSWKRLFLNLFIILSSLSIYILKYYFFIESSSRLLQYKLCMHNLKVSSDVQVTWITLYICILMQSTVSFTFTFLISHLFSSLSLIIIDFHLRASSKICKEKLKDSIIYHKYRILKLKSILSRLFYRVSRICYYFPMSVVST